MMGKKALLFIIFTVSISSSFAQQLLGKVVSITANNQPLAQVLETISQKGNFRFSYKSNIIIEDKKVSITASNKTVKHLLDLLFEGNFHYSEKRNYVILHAGGERFFTISGYVQNGKTGERISNASIYEEQLLASTLSNEQGYFKLQLKNKKHLKSISITVSKDQYSDQFLALSAGYDQELNVPIIPSKEIKLNDVEIFGEKENWVNSFLLSSKLRIQNINISNFFARSPIQTSILPGIGTHGLFGAQIVNKVSLNILGGYTGGVNGLEIGSLFNINRGSVRYFQAAGIFNTTYGNVHGTQYAGIYNYVTGNLVGAQFSGIFTIVKGNTSGAQVAGISNYVKGKLKGVQIAGINNQNNGQVWGVQLAGLVNKNKGMSSALELSGLANWNDTFTKGFQLTGLLNCCRTKMKGVQISSFVNFAQQIKGFQFGLINIADSMDGVGIGLVNYYKNGKHKFVVSSSDIQHLNIGYLSGSKMLYSIVGFGTNINPQQQCYSVFYGIGKEINIGKHWAINPEITGQSFYIGMRNYAPLVGKMQIGVTYKIKKEIEIFAALNHSIAEDRKINSAKNFSPWLAKDNVTFLNWQNNQLAHWTGWQIGLRIF